MAADRSLSEFVDGDSDTISTDDEPAISEEEAVEAVNYALEAVASDDDQEEIEADSDDGPDCAECGSENVKRERASDVWPGLPDKPLCEGCMMEHA